jgi:hypothetical protein
MSLNYPQKCNTVVFILSLFSDAFNNLDFIASNDRMISQ